MGENDLLPSANNKIKTVLQRMLKNKEIEKKLCEYLYIKRTELSRFYLLPEIHKILVNVPGRPAISNNNRARKNVSAYLDHHLKSLIPNIPYILEDIRDFLCRINEIDNIPDNAILVSFGWTIPQYPTRRGH